MRTVLFCGGLGTRIRDYSETVPKPLVPIGGVPVIRHIMQYYEAYGHRRFILALGHYADKLNGHFSETAWVRRDAAAGIKVMPVHTGLNACVGERLYALRDLMRGEDMFMANYSDVLTDAPLDHMIEAFRKSGKAACFLAVHMPTTYHLVNMDEAGEVTSLTPSADADLWINGGYFILRPDVFDYMQPGEELVEEPFARMIEDDALMAWRHTGFWRPMDTLRDRDYLQAMAERGLMPWTPAHRMAAAE